MASEAVSSRPEIIPFPMLGFRTIISFIFNMLGCWDCGILVFPAFIFIYFILMYHMLLNHFPILTIHMLGIGNN